PNAGTRGAKPVGGAGVGGVQCSPQVACLGYNSKRKPNRDVQRADLLIFAPGWIETVVNTHGTDWQFVAHACADAVTQAVWREEWIVLGRADAAGVPEGG